MICGIGIDSVETNRFADWHTKSHSDLTRIFSDDEITFCTESSPQSAQHFATRFAAREALYKAIGHCAPEHTLPFLTLCPHVSVHKQNNGMPFLKVNWQALLTHLPSTLTAAQTLLTITHTQTVTTACVVILMQ